MPDATEHDVDHDGGARCVLAVRRMMKDTIEAELVLNPAIDMLIALYLARHEERPVSQQEVCAATDVAASVCHRWGLALEQRGLVIISDDGYRLSDEGERVMTRVNEQIWSLAAQYMSRTLVAPR